MCLKWSPAAVTSSYHEQQQPNEGLKYVCGVAGTNHLTPRPGYDEIIAAYIRQLHIFVLRVPEISVCPEVFFGSLFVSPFVGSPQSRPRSTLWSKLKWQPKFHQSFVSAK